MRYILIVIIFLVCSCGSNKREQQTTEEKSTTPNKAEALFQEKCSQCHRCDMDLTGPALKGSLDRWKDKTELFNFVRNSSTVIRSNKYAQDLFKKYNETFMNPFPDLSDAEIEAILNQCK